MSTISFEPPFTPTPIRVLFDGSTPYLPLPDFIESLPKDFEPEDQSFESFVLKVYNSGSGSQYFKDFMSVGSEGSSSDICISFEGVRFIAALIPSPDHELAETVSKVLDDFAVEASVEQPATASVLGKRAGPDDVNCDTSSLDGTVDKRRVLDDISVVSLSSPRVGASEKQGLSSGTVDFMAIVSQSPETANTLLKENIKLFDELLNKARQGNAEVDAMVTNLNFDATAKQNMERHTLYLNTVMRNAEQDFKLFEKRQNLHIEHQKQILEIDERRFLLQKKELELKEQKRLIEEKEAITGSKRNKIKADENAVDRERLALRRANLDMEVATVLLGVDKDNARIKSVAYLSATQAAGGGQNVTVPRVPEVKLQRFDNYSLDGLLNAKTPASSAGKASAMPPPPAPTGSGKQPGPASAAGSGKQPAQSTPASGKPPLPVAQPPPLPSSKPNAAAPQRVMQSPTQQQAGTQFAFPQSVMQPIPIQAMSFPMGMQFGNQCATGNKVFVFNIFLKIFKSNNKIVFRSLAQALLGRARTRPFQRQHLTGLWDLFILPMVE
jgi:hypothetical protein